MGSTPHGVRTSLGDCQRWNEGVAAIRGVLGYVLKFHTRVKIHSQESFAAVLGLAHSVCDVAEERLIAEQKN